MSFGLCLAATPPETTHAMAKPQKKKAPLLQRGFLLNVVLETTAVWVVDNNCAVRVRNILDETDGISE